MPTRTRKQSPVSTARFRRTRKHISNRKQRLLKSKSYHNSKKKVLLGGTDDSSNSDKIPKNIVFEGLNNFMTKVYEYKIKLLTNIQTIELNSSNNNSNSSAKNKSVKKTNFFRIFSTRKKNNQINPNIKKLNETLNSISIIEKFISEINASYEKENEINMDEFFKILATNLVALGYKDCSINAICAYNKVLFYINPDNIDKELSNPFDSKKLKEDIVKFITDAEQKHLQKINKKKSYVIKPDDGVSKEVVSAGLNKFKAEYEQKKQVLKNFLLSYQNPSSNNSMGGTINEKLTLFMDKLGRLDTYIKSVETIISNAENINLNINQYIETFSQELNELNELNGSNNQCGKSYEELKAEDECLHTIYAKLFCYADFIEQCKPESGKLGFCNNFDLLNAGCFPIDTNKLLSDIEYYIKMVSQSQPNESDI